MNIETFLKTTRVSNEFSVWRGSVRGHVSHKRRTETTPLLRAWRRIVGGDVPLRRLLVHGVSRTRHRA
jgi:hypothetical protein